MLNKRIASVLSVVLACGILAAGCGNSGNEGGSRGESANIDSDTNTDKPSITLMIEVGGYPPLQKAVEMTKEKFPEYNIISKEWSVDGVKKAIKTTYASGGDESVDIAFNSATGIMGFAEADMLLDLTPYLEADTEWRDALQEDMLNTCTYEGDIYGIPWQAAYPVMVANEDVFEDAGIEIKDDWTYDELMEVCEKLKEKGYFALGVSSGYNAWLIRQSYLNGFETEEELDQFNKGEISIHNEKVIEAFDRVKALYENNYCYPGEGAIATTDDECKVGMTNGKIAMVATTNGAASSFIDECGVSNARIVNFPSFSNYSTENLLGSPDVYIVPANAKNQEAVIEVLKYLTGEEVLTAMANIGTVVPLKEVDTEIPDYAEFSKDISRLHPMDFGNLSDEIGDYINTGTAVTNYLYEGESALDELEQMRKTAIGE